jgi:hypothetical protein
MRASKITAFLVAGMLIPTMLGCGDGETRPIWAANLNSEPKITVVQVDLARPIVDGDRVEVLWAARSGKLPNVLTIPTWEFGETRRLRLSTPILTVDPIFGVTTGLGTPRVFVNGTLVVDGEAMSWSERLEISGTPLYERVVTPVTGTILTSP